jgi:membrane protein implicated in regulation of membrane protease activity
MMERNHIILLMLLGAAVVIFSVVTFQWYLALVFVAIVVIVLLALDFKKWVESLVEKIATAREYTDASERTGLPGSIASMKAELAGIERRLDALERGGRK